MYIFADHISHHGTKSSSDSIHVAGVYLHPDNKYVVWHWRRKRGPDSPLVLTGWTMSTSDLDTATKEMERVIVQQP